MIDFPKNLSEQLRREALTRAGVIGAMQDKLLQNSKFDEFWAVINADRETLVHERDTLRTDLASCQSDLAERDEQLRLARMALARAAELLGDSAKPFVQACDIIRAQLP